MADGKSLNRVAANYMWGPKPKSPNDPSGAEEAATPKERQNISKMYQQEPGSFSEKIRKLFQGK